MVDVDFVSDMLSIISDFTFLISFAVYAWLFCWLFSILIKWFVKNTSVDQKSDFLAAHRPE